MTRKTARIAILFIWTGAVALMTPWAIYYHYHPVIETSVQTIYVSAAAIIEAKFMQ